MIVCSPLWGFLALVSTPRILISVIVDKFLGTGKKTAKKFDLDKMFEETKSTAKAYSLQITGMSVSLHY